MLEPYGVKQKRGLQVARLVRMVRGCRPLSHFPRTAAGTRRRSIRSARHALTRAYTLPSKENIRQTEGYAVRGVASELPGMRHSRTTARRVRAR